MLGACVRRGPIKAGEGASGVAARLRAGGEMVLWRVSGGEGGVALREQAG